MPRRKLCILLALLSWAMATISPVLVGQDLPMGRRVRLTFADSSTYVGRLDSTQNARLWLAANDAQARAVELGRVTRMEVSRGRRPRWLLGAGLGAIAGLVTGAILKNVAEPNVDSEDEGLLNVAYLGGGALGGTLVGTGLSIVLARERWDVVPHVRWAFPEAHHSRHAAGAWQFGFRLSH